MLRPEPAVPDDADGILQMRESAARWLLSKGVRQWEPGEVTLAEVVQQVHDRQWWVLRGGGRLRGALRLLDEDPATWLEPGSEAALYVHGLVVARDESGAALGAALLRWAESVAEQRKVALLRLDAVESNARLRAYYRNYGFREVGRVDPNDPRWYPAVLLEKRLQVS